MLVHLIDVVAPNAVESRTDRPDASIEVPAADAESEVVTAGWKLIQFGGIGPGSASISPFGLVGLPRALASRLSRG
jgi:hypothetical protein